MVTTRGNAEHPCAVGCGLQAHEHRICSICAGNLQRWLAETPALADDLDITLSRQARIGGATNGSRTAERPLPYDPRASEAGDVLHSTLVGWVRDLNDGDDQPRDSLHELSRWLFVRIERLVGHPAAEEAVDEIGAAYALARRAIDRPPLRIYAGLCGNDGCTVGLYAKPMSPDVTCPGCGTRHSVAERREHMLAELDGMLLTTSEIARLATYFDGYNSDRARKLLTTWAIRGRILEHTVDRDGRPLYPFGETLALLLATPRRTRSAVA